VQEPKEITHENLRSLLKLIVEDGYPTIIKDEIELRRAWLRKMQAEINIDWQLLDGIEYFFVTKKVQEMEKVEAK
jgi:hypothetical protein